MQLDVVKAKQYDHIFESYDGSPQDLIDLQNKIDLVFRGQRCQRILMVHCPHSNEETFSWESARLRRYPSYPPYGPGLLVRILEENGYIADIIDLDYEILAHAIDSDTGFDFNVWQRKLREKIDDFEPDLVGVSCMYNRSHQTLKSVVNYLSGNYPHIARVVGGVHVSLATEQLMEDIQDIDFAMLYEADQSFPYFLDIVNGRRSIEDIAQIATVHNGRLIKLSKRLVPEQLTYSPDYKDLPITDYARVGKIGAYTFLRPVTTPAASVLSARGCRARCGFCSVRSVNGKGVRTRDYQIVVDEIERLHVDYGIKHITWLDDDLFYDGERAVALFEELAARNLAVTWCASNGIIAAALTPRLLQACVDSKCVGFNIGIESGNPEILLQMKKPGTVATFRRAANLLKNAPNIFTKGFLVIGSPNETLAMLMDTVNLAIELQFDWYPIQILTPMPGTPVFQMMQDMGLLGDIPATTLGKARTFQVGATGSLGKREKAEKEKARDFNNLFSGDRSRVPDRTEMEDLWFTIDYKINYEIMLEYTDINKINKKRLMLREICERMTTENALGTLFLAIAEDKLGNHIEAARLFELTKAYLNNSAFWQKRFETLNINNLLP